MVQICTFFHITNRDQPSSLRCLSTIHIACGENGVDGTLILPPWKCGDVHTHVGCCSRICDYLRMLSSRLSFFHERVRASRTAPPGAATVQLCPSAYMRP